MGIPDRRMDIGATPDPETMVKPANPLQPLIDRLPKVDEETNEADIWAMERIAFAAARTRELLPSCKTEGFGYEVVVGIVPKGHAKTYYSDALSNLCATLTGSKPDSTTEQEFTEWHPQDIPGLSLCRQIVSEATVIGLKTDLDYFTLAFTPQMREVIMQAEPIRIPEGLLPAEISAVSELGPFSSP